mmetsp:Transcript_25613/g.70417  ORF Transcript_25613/g.70417 Transcript_25613/m.70417 type:complete len:287 (-) Transcript_25613:2895-3755(-)
MNFKPWCSRAPRARRQKVEQPAGFWSFQLLLLLGALGWWHCRERLGKLVEDRIEGCQRPRGHPHKARVAARPAPAGDIVEVLAQPLKLKHVGEPGGNGRGHNACAGARKLDGPGVLIELVPRASLAHLAPRAPSRALKVHTRREEHGSRPAHLVRRWRLVHAEHCRQGGAAHAPLAHGPGEVRNHGHVARAPGGGQHRGCATQGVGVVAVEVRGHGAARLVAQELADWREAAAVTACLFALLELVLHKPGHQTLCLQLRELQDLVALALQKQLLLDEVRQALEKRA